MNYEIQNPRQWHIARDEYTILIACEYSGAVRDAFIDRGFTSAISCDLIPSESNKGGHTQGDVCEYLDANWDMVIAFPPCTRLCNSGVRWLRERDLWDELDQAAAFFSKCLNANARYVAVENPIMHKHAIKRIGRKHDFSIQPYEFGVPESKRTCFWTRNLPRLMPTEILSTYNQSVWRMGPSKNRAKERSRTHKKIAEAIALQWGEYMFRMDNAIPFEGELF